MLIDNVNSPSDIKNMTIQELESLAGEIRQGIITRVDKIGGHLGPDLGIVEMTIALHYVFDSPKDKIIFDISHQCYPHKMLTGRKGAFFHPEKFPEISGFTNPRESEHDMFVIGHTSTSVSLASGVVKARDLHDDNYNVIAIIGDGSLSGGEAFEGLNNASVLNSNFIIIVNDNEMSIAENQGGLYDNLSELRKTSGKSQNNFFKTLGFDYIYLDEGNDISKLIELFNSVKNITHPIILHIHTTKGKGYLPAMINKEFYHFASPNFLKAEEDGKAIVYLDDYVKVTQSYLEEKYNTNKDLLVVNPATPSPLGLTKDFRLKLGKNYTDVGIAEEHAIAYLSGAAQNGAKPILAIFSSFLQRTYDQLSQDLAINNSPATILVFFAGISNADMTHLSCFDIPLVSNIPNIVYLAPTNKQEYLRMLDWSVEQTQYPVAIRVPYGELKDDGIVDNTDYSQLNKFKVVEEGSKIAIIALGTFFSLGVQVKNEIYQKLNIKSTLINPKFISGLDEELLNDIKKNHEIVITLESGILDGGFGQKLSSFYGKDDIKVLNYGAKKEFTDRVPYDELLKINRLTKEQIVEDIKKLVINS